MKALAALPVLFALLASTSAVAAPHAAPPAGAAADSVAARDRFAAVRALTADARFAAAESSGRALLETETGRAAADSLGVARALDVLVDALIAARKTRSGEARALARQAVDLRQRHGRPDDPELALSLGNWGSVLHAQGADSVADLAYRRAIAIAERSPGSGDVPLIRALIGAGVMRRDARDYGGASSVLERAVSVSERARGRDDPLTARAVGTLAATRYLAGDFYEARLLFERALASALETLRPDHPDLAILYNNRAALERDEGDFVAARDDNARCLRILMASYGPEHPVTATSMSSLGVVLGELGETDSALVLCRRALHILESANPGSPQVAGMLINLAIVYQNGGDFVSAEQPIERALAIRRQLSPISQPVAEALNNLGVVMRGVGLDTVALGHLREAVAIEERAEGLNDLSLALYLTNLGRTLHETGAYAAARDTLDRALAIRRTWQGDAHPDVAWTMSELAQALSGLRDSTSALTVACDAERIHRDHFRLLARALPERSALGFSYGGAWVLDRVLTLAAGRRDSAAIALAWDALIRSRAMVLDEIATRHRIVLAATDSATTALASASVRAGEGLATLLTRGAGSRGPGAYAAALDSARRAQRLAEQALAERSAGLRGQLARSAIGYPQLAGALPPGWGLVAYARYSDASVHGPRSRTGEAARYAAFVLSGTQGRPGVVPLGGGSTIDSLVTMWREQVESPSPKLAARARATGLALERRIWEPVTARLAGADRVFIVADGALQLVSFAALPSGASRYEIERGPTLQYLSAERDLVPGDTSAARGRGLLALGNPDYDASPERMASVSFPGGHPSTTSVYRGTPSDCPDFRNARWPPLPSTGVEANDVAEAWRRHATGDRTATAAVELDATVLSGAAASEAAFRAQAPGREVVHLATHGFFLSGSCALVSGRSRGIAAMVSVPKTAPPAAPPAGGPLRLSGLVLAGANRRDLAATSADDGILTAEEAATLDLRSVDWAVLSACETGVGDVSGWEGVQGLRRAFQVAGAHTVIMSLWPLEDRSARDWMRALYRARLERHLDTPGSVRQAALEVLERRRSRHLDTSPFYWGAFVAVGDWR